jgi:hypothetical protein
MLLGKTICKSVNIFLSSSLRITQISRGEGISAIVADMVGNAELAIETIGMLGGSEEIVVRQKGCGEREQYEGEGA